GGLGSGDNPFSFYCVAILFITFTRFVLRKRPMYLVFSVILVVWIALTVTRVAALASVVGLGVIGLLATYATGHRKLFFITATVVGVAGLAFAPNVLQRSLGFVPTAHELFQIVRNPVVLYNAINWQGRQLLWAIAWAAFMASPLFGLGMGSSAAVIRESFPDQDVKVVHNEYLRLAVDTGLIGVALFAVSIITWLVAAIRLSRNGDNFVRELAFPAVAGIVAWGLISITDNPFDYYAPFTQYVAFLVAGAVAAQESSS
ncbi:MAG TPA: O-antigen ligase family protein, partial [Longimicrobiales bacterium]|nr:O-antigen ligase family protein [Longimicrobiales bacterium]